LNINVLKISQKHAILERRKISHRGNFHPVPRWNGTEETLVEQRYRFTIDGMNDHLEVKLSFFLLLYNTTCLSVLLKTLIFNNYFPYVIHRIKHCNCTEELLTSLFNIWKQVNLDAYFTLSCYQTNVLEATIIVALYFIQFFSSCHTM